MSVIFTIFAWLVVAATVSVVLVELKRDLMMMQQNSYRNERYNRWLQESGDSTSIVRLIGIIVLMLEAARFTSYRVDLILIGCWDLYYLCTHLRRKYKKPLVWTARACRIYAVSVVLALVVGIILMILPKASTYCINLTFAMLLCYCLSHGLMEASVWLLKPYEKMVTKRYYRDAQRILQSMPGLKIIGVTGSYGKTSTKYYLQRILSEQYNTLMTPGSFNTTLGVVRTVREHLKPSHEVFIVEMGAKQRGDVAEICDLVKPQTAIVTAVGPQHLETFHSIDNVLATKFELVDSLGVEGTAIVNNDFEPIAGRKVENCKCLRYTADNQAGADVRAEDISYTRRGTDFTLMQPGYEPLRLHTRLLGEFNVSNIVAAAAAARLLGVSDAKIARAVEHIEPVEHRLSIKQTPGGVTILDDAFNSNPVGSRMALKVLGAMEGGKRIVVTPGMIELGEQQYELNRAFGRYIAENADVAVVVGHYNRDAILEGINEVGNKDLTVHQVDAFAQVSPLLAQTLKAGDVILYENDLPDTFK